MRPALVFLAAALALAAAAPVALAQDAPEGLVVREKPVSADDEASLNKNFGDAVQAARASLKVFWGRLSENPNAGPDDFQLKVAFRTPQGGVEDVWLSDIKHDGARIVGRLGYEPDNLPSMHRGQIVPIAEGNIIDWTFKEGRKRYGHFTTRVIAKAHPEEAAKTLAALSDNPLPLDARK
ncbi:MAG TPA: DUF2314 domain-containing protein [Caulobacteraceae bacterium]|jgi:uncharacterized protein YegJ (DUF2314 family)